MNNNDQNFNVMMMGMANMGGRKLFTENNINMLSFLQELQCSLGETGNRLIEEENNSEEDNRFREEEDSMRRAFR